MIIPGSHKAAEYSLPALLFLSGLAIFFFFSTYSKGEENASWNSQEWRTIQSLTLSNLQDNTDPGNRFLNNPEAIAFGEKLFFDKRLSQTKHVSCASCHQPDKFFTDGRVVALGKDIGKRNTPSLHGVSYNTWFFWDGRKDSLWSQALAPLENPVEHDFSRTQVAKLIAQDKEYLNTYTALFGKKKYADIEALPDRAKPSGTIEQIKAWKKIPDELREATDLIFANTGKAIAAFVNTIKPVHTRFDKYVKAYNKGDHTNQHLSKDELAGLRVFINNKSQCLSCHFGPLFTNQSFHNIGTGQPRVDSGRAAALDQLRFDRFNCQGKYSDKAAEDCLELKFLQRDKHSVTGAFKTPTLRNVSNTAPYFHDGRSVSLAAVIDHYAQAKTDETHLQAIELSDKDKKDLVAFLNALAADQ